MPTLNLLEQRKHDLRCEMVRLRADKQPVQMCKVYGKILETYRVREYFQRVEEHRKQERRV